MLHKFGKFKCSMILVIKITQTFQMTFLQICWVSNDPKVKRKVSKTPELGSQVRSCHTLNATLFLAGYGHVKSMDLKELDCTIRWWWGAKCKSSGCHFLGSYYYYYLRCNVRYYYSLPLNLTWHNTRKFNPWSII